MTAIGSATSSPGVFVSPSTPLIGLNYYDGRFLRADDLNLERQGQRAYVEYSNQASGAGVAYGFDLTVQGTQLWLSAGLAVDPGGQVLYLADAASAEIGDLIKASAPSNGTAPGTTASSAGFGPCDQAAAPAGAGTSTAGGSALYLVCLSRVQQLCGQGEVLGRICADACVTATDQLYLIDGVRLSLVPLTLQNPLPTLPGVTRPEVHLRSQVASAFFADEWDLGGSQLSAVGLRTPVWCAGHALGRLRGRRSRGRPGLERFGRHRARRMDGPARTRRDPIARLLGRADGTAAVAGIPRPGPPVPVPAVRPEPAGCRHRPRSWSTAGSSNCRRRGTCRWRSRPAPSCASSCKDYSETAWTCDSAPCAVIRSPMSSSERST